MFQSIIICAIFINFITCLTVRAMHGGRFDYDPDVFPNYSGKNILIAGMFGQPETAFQYIDLPYCYSGYLRYSMLGYNPINAGRQLSALAREKDCVLAVSVGCKAIVYAGIPGAKRVFVNPCTHPKSLEPKLKRKLRIITPILEILSYLLGWFTVIPVIKTRQGERYSPALFIDQLFWACYGDPDYSKVCYQGRTGIVLSTRDEYIENDVVSKIYDRAEKVIIPARHGFIASPYVSNLYNEAINNLLVL